MKNKIIIEGFWGAGKTELAESFKNDDYFIIYEPEHLDKGIPQKDVNGWYISRHLENQAVFFGEKNRPIICERSILASAAFLYAVGKKIDGKSLDGFIEKYKEQKPIIVFLYATGKNIDNLGDKVKNPVLKELLKSRSFIQKNEEFFRNILPFTYGITPLFVDVFSGTARKTVTQIKEEINTAIRANRLAQVSIFCYKNEKKPSFLLLKRIETKGGFWQGITGGVEKGEFIKEALAREMQEELGLKARFEDILETKYFFSFTGSEGYELQEYVFGYRIRGADKFFLSQEHSESKFFFIEEALELLKYETNKRALEKISEIIKKA